MYTNMFIFVPQSPCFKHLKIFLLQLSVGPKTARFVDVVSVAMATSKSMASIDAAGYREVVSTQDQQQMATWHHLATPNRPALGERSNGGWKTPEEMEVKQV